MSAKVLEVCAADIDSVRAAAEGGAARVELCSGLAEGGMTPSIGLIKSAVAVGGVKVNVLIRPRPGDFVYTADEVECMVSDIEACREAGVNGVVIGALTPDGDIDMTVCRRLVEVAGGMSVTFHRAFDMCANPLDAIEQLIELGCARVLTSGCSCSAEAGISTLRELHRRAGGRIIILAGGGVCPDNSGSITAIGLADELHASARATVPSVMRYRNDGVSMGTPGSDEYSRKVSSPDIIRAIIENMQ